MVVADCKFIISTTTHTGERHAVLAKALEKAPPKSYLDAMAALMKWIEGVELLLESEVDQANYLHVMEEQVSQYQVNNVSVCVLKVNMKCIIV